MKKDITIETIESKYENTENMKFLTFEDGLKFIEEFSDKQIFVIGGVQLLENSKNLFGGLHLI